METVALVLGAIDVTHLVVTLVIGGVIGWVASIVMKTNAQMGIVVGIGGALLGGWLAPMLGIAAAGTMGSWLIALGGAVLLIIGLRFLGVLR